ncbi:MAG TPA: DNA polymerase III subunit delta [Syntrophomonadaceae bacterium]|nr:DNA polymerase III subunit delta [Syntrophomonadaceae bacterium]
MPAKNIFLLYGEEDYLINETIKEKINSLKEEYGEPELVYIDDDETNLTQLQNFITYNSLFSFFRVVVIKKPFWLQKTSRRSGRNKEVLEIFKHYFLDSNPQQMLIVTTEELVRSNPIYKLFAQNAEVIECKRFSQGELKKWLIKSLDSRGIKADEAALNMLVDSGQNMYHLENLLEKFALNKTANITKRELENELESNVEIKIFKLTDALFSKNIKMSLNALHQLIEQGESAQYFLAMINSQFISFAKIKAGVDKGYNRDKIGEVTGLHPFMIRNMLKHVGKYNWPELWDIFEILLATDIKLKTTSIDKNILMESLVIEICSG